jgi:hypothetical protein
MFSTSSFPSHFIVASPPCIQAIPVNETTLDPFFLQSGITIAFLMMDFNDLMYFTLFDEKPKLRF